MNLDPPNNVNVFPIIYIDPAAKNPSYLLQINQWTSKTEYKEIGNTVKLVELMEGINNGPFNIGVDSAMPIHERYFYQAENLWRASLNNDRIISYVVLRSFAIELYYKTIAYFFEHLETKDQIHNIQDLHYKGIPENWSITIQGIFEGFINLNAPGAYFNEIRVSTYHQNIKSLHDLLKIINNALVDTRYSLENCNPTDLPLATRALRLSLLGAIGQFWKQEYLMMP